MTGSGTVGDPYIIQDVDDLQDMGNNSPYAPTAYYELASHIDASATTGWNWNAGRGVYEGFQPRYFRGRLDGKWFSITNLYIDRYSDTSDLNVGLFQEVYSESGSPGTVRNIEILNADMTGESYGALVVCCVGVVTGRALSHSLLECIYTTGVIKGTCTDTGGAGHASSNVGGIAGTAFQAEVNIKKSATNVNVEAIGLDEACARAGGILGSYSSGSGSIQDCYGRGTVNAESDGYTAHAAGLVGYHDGSKGAIDNSYSTGTVTTSEHGGSYAGGLVAQFDYRTTDCFWDVATSGQASSAGGTGKSTAQMKTKSTFTDAGWDFVSIWSMGGEHNDGYPILDVFPPGVGGFLWVEGEKLCYGTYSYPVPTKYQISGTTTGQTGTAGHLWIEGNYLHWIDQLGDERRSEGTAEGATGQTAGHTWVEGSKLRYIDSSGNERYIEGT